jgi:hypothetical protein
MSYVSHVQVDSRFTQDQQLTCRGSFCWAMQGVAFAGSLVAQRAHGPVKGTVKCVRDQLNRYEIYESKVALIFVQLHPLLWLGQEFSLGNR